MNGYVLKRLRTLKKTEPVVFGQQPSRKKMISDHRKKGSKMLFENSRYAKPRIKKNPWREVIISEANLIDALTYALRIHTQLKGSERIERVIVGEPENGQYPLSVAIVKKEVIEQDNGA